MPGSSARTSMKLDTGESVVAKIGAENVVVNSPFESVVPEGGLTLPGPEATDTVTLAPAKRSPSGSRTVTVTAALPPDATAEGADAVVVMRPGGAGSRRIQDQ